MQEIDFGGKMTNLGVGDWRVGEGGKIQVKQVQDKDFDGAVRESHFSRTTIILVAPEFLTQPYQLHPTISQLHNLPPTPPHLLLFDTSTNDIHYRWLK